MRLPRSLILLFLTIAAIGFAGPAATQAQSGERCFPETGYCISGRIREFWEKNGGLPVFGFPIGPQQEMIIEGKPYQAQNFERNRLELHPENKAPYDVLLGRLGADRLSQLGKDWQSYPKSGNQVGCRYFPETNQSVCGAILKAWRANGLEIDGKRGKSEAENLALFGLPLSGLVTERMADGVERQVQWFERARFELHPQNAPPYDVLLGLLGNELRDAANAKPADPCADVPEPKNATITPSKCFKAGTVMRVTVTGFKPNEQIGFWLTAPDGSMLGTVRTFKIGASGGGYLDWDTTDMPPGIWFWVFEGVTSKHQSIAHFKILP